MDDLSPLRAKCALYHPAPPDDDNGNDGVYLLITRGHDFLRWGGLITQIFPDKIYAPRYDHIYIFNFYYMLQAERRSSRSCSSNL